jgi:hypothetical protein
MRLQNRATLRGLLPAMLGKNTLRMIPCRYAVLDLHIDKTRQSFYSYFLSLIRFRRKDEASCSSKEIAQMNYACNFARGAWKADEWTLVKSPRWDHFGGWVQGEDYIQNETPDVPDKRLFLENQQLAEKTYSSMVLARPIEGNFNLNVRMSFLDRMAPLVVLAPELEQDDKGRPHYGKHFEFVLYDLGINVWEHFYSRTEGPSWMLRGFMPRPLNANQTHSLTLQLKHHGRRQAVNILLNEQVQMTIGLEIGPKMFAGITGCEGENRFYSFELSQS